MVQADNHSPQVQAPPALAAEMLLIRMGSQKCRTPGVVLLARPLGLLDLIDGGQRDKKVLAASNTDPRFDEVRSVDQVGSHSLREIEEFFAIYKKLEGKQVEVNGWRGPDEARSLIAECRQRYLKSHTSE